MCGSPGLGDMNNEEIQNVLDDLSPGQSGDKAEKKLNFKKISEILSFEYPPQHWIIENLIPKSGITLLTGDPGSGKSLLALYLSIQVCKGKKVFGRAVPGGQRVLYVDAENPEFLIQKRARKLGSGEEDNLFILSKESFFKADNPENIEELRGFVKENLISLIVFDSYAELHSGDENQAGDMTKRVYESLRPLINDGVGIILIHHHRKNNAFQKTGLQSVKGSITIVGFADCLLMLEGEEDELNKRSVLNIRQEKNRFGQKVKPFRVDFYDSDDGEKIIFDFKGETENELGLRLRAQELVLEILKNNKRVKRQAIVGTLQNQGIGESTAERALADLKGMGKIKGEKGNKMLGEDNRSVYFMGVEEDINPYLESIVNGEIPF